MRYRTHSRPLFAETYTSFDKKSIKANRNNIIHSSFLQPSRLALNETKLLAKFHFETLQLGNMLVLCRSFASSLQIVYNI